MIRKYLPVISAILFIGAALAFGAPAMADPGALSDFAAAGAVPFLIGEVARSPIPWGRIREPMKAFSNVPAGVPTTVTTVFSKIPRYPRTVLGLQLQLGGTTFTKALISRVEILLGETSIWGPVSGSEIDAINTFQDGLANQSDFFLPIDFTFKGVKEIGGEQIGGLDLSMLGDGELRVEVDLAVGVSAPTLRGDVIWGPTQGGSKLAGLMKKLIRRTYPQAPAGDFFPDVVLRDAAVARSYLFSTVATAAVTAVQAAGPANTGNGVLGAVTVTARTPAGRYTLRITEPAANAGNFRVEGPDGQLIGHGTVAVAFAAGGLSFTLADGAADFVAGDGFTIDVLPLNTDQNINSVIVRKDEIVHWQRSDRAARFEQQRYGRAPLSQLYVVDFLLDNHIDSVLKTIGAQSLDVVVNVTAADTVTFVHEVLAPAVAPRAA